MVAKEFLKALGTTTDDFIWKYVENNRIRGFLKSDDSGRTFDPIEATAVALGLSEVHGMDLGQALGLSPLDREALADAANCNVWKSHDDGLVLDGYAAWLRDRLALAVGLQPDEVPLCAPRERFTHAGTLVISTSETGLDSEAHPQTV